MSFWHLFSRKRKKASVERRRLKLSRRLTERFDFTIGYGLFSGMRLVEEATWGPADRAAMLLGIYEQEVLNSLTKVPSTHRTFVELGSADGYYGVRALFSGRFDRAICYEQNSVAREITKRCAEINNVSERLTIRGEVQHGFWKELSSSELQQSVLLVDIEGGEFALFDEESFERLKRCVIIIELHENSNDAAEDILRLITLAEATHTVSKFSTSSRDLSGYPELKKLSDTDRWLMCSEGRPYLMSWVRLDPIDLN